MRRVSLVALAILLLLPLAVVLGARAALNTAAMHERILAAMQRTTGHATRIDGPVGVAWSLTPAFVADDVALLNESGFSRPDFMSVRRIEAQLALLPLLEGRVSIPSLTVEGADILLERDAAGRGNWLPAAPPAPASSKPGATSARTPVEVRRLQVSGGQVGWRGEAPLLIRSLSAVPAGGPLAGTLEFHEIPFELKGQTQAMTPAGLPFSMTVAGGGIALAVSGQAGGAGGANIAFQAAAPDLSAVAPLAGRALPPLKDVVLTGQAGPEGPMGLTIAAGAADLAAWMPGLRLAKLEASMTAPGQPVQIAAQASLRDLPFAAAATLGRLGADPMPVAVQLSGDGASASVQGTVSDAGRTVDAALTAHVPDVRHTGALAGIVLPALRDAALDFHLSPDPAGPGLLLRGLRLSAAQGDIAGDLVLGWAPKLSVRGSLASQRLDLDAWPAPPPLAAAPAASAAPASVSPAPEGAHWVIPDRPLPFAVLRRADADVRYTVVEATYKGAAYRQGDLHVQLQDGRLRLDPLSVQVPGGAVRGVLQADADASPPTASLTLRAPGLDAAGLSDALGAPAVMTGALDFDADLRAAGATPHAMAASVSGHAAFALANGDIANAALAQLFGGALRGANIPFDSAGRSQVRCMAARSEASDGKASLQTLTLDTSRLRLEGDGQLNLGNETMDLHMRPVIRLGPANVSVPIRLSGPFQSPRAQADKGVLSPGRFGISIGAASADPCGPALAAVHQDLGQ